MPHEIRILVPDQQVGEPTDIKVFRNGLEQLEYRLELFNFHASKQPLSRAQFIMECIDNYNPDYEVAQIDLFQPHLIAVLFALKGTISQPVKDQPC